MKRGGVLGWMLLGALLFGSIGALLYVAAGERGHAAATQPLAAPGSGSAAGTGSGSGSALAAPDANGASGLAPGTTGASNSVTVPAARPDATTAAGVIETAPARRPIDEVAAPIVKSSGPGADHDGTDDKAARKPGKQTEGQALLEQGLAFERAHDYASARTTYEKLAKVPGMKGQALYLQANAAFYAYKTDDAVTLAAKAVAEPGGPKVKAKFLYGDALFRQRNYERARDVFVSLRGSAVGEDKAVATRKIAACNQQLGKPDAEGIKAK